jgi:hypothetical protein
MGYPIITRFHLKSLKIIAHFILTVSSL